MYCSERIVNKPDEREWQAHWEKCSIMVSLEPPHTRPPRPQFSREAKIFRVDLTSVMYCRMRRDKHDGEG